jgi:hypothetical protein
MGRIEYWLLGAVGALIGFIAYESVRSSVEPRRYAVQIEQAGHPRDTLLAPPDSNATSDAPSTTFDVHSAVRPSRAPAPPRNPADIRRRIADAAQRTYILDILASQDSVLFRWPDNPNDGAGLRVWIQSNPHVPDWWVGYVQSARDVFLEWETAGIPVRFTFPNDSANAEIVLRWIDRFPPDELRIGKTRRLADQNAWVTHAEVVVALHDRDGDAFPPGEISEILRHEIGHALGLGHSRNRATIMYPENTQLDLTDLDRETLHLLYTLPPGKVK